MAVSPQSAVFSVVKETVYITGGSGLLAVNWAITVRDRFRVVAGLHRRVIAPRGVETRRVCLESVDAIIADLEAIQPRFVIHTAAFANVDGCEKDPAEAHRVNAELAENVAAACSLLGVRLAHISTDHLFSGEVPLVDEGQPPDPVNEYARSKAEAESLVLAANPSALVIRTDFFCWGPLYRSSFSDSVITSLRAGREVLLFRDFFFTPLLAETVANATHDLLDRDATGILNVAGDDRITKWEFGCLLAEEFGLDTSLLRPGVLADRPTLVQRPHDMSLSNGRVCKLLGKKFGGVRREIARLHEQEKQGIAREIQSL